MTQLELRCGNLLFLFLIFMPSHDTAGLASLLGIYLIFYPFYFQGKAAMVHDKLEIITVIIFPGDKYK